MIHNKTKQKGIKTKIQDNPAKFLEWYSNNIEKGEGDGRTNKRI